MQTVRRRTLSKVTGGRSTGLGSCGQLASVLANGVVLAVGNTFSLSAGMATTEESSGTCDPSSSKRARCSCCCCGFASGGCCCIASSTRRLYARMASWFDLRFQESEGKIKLFCSQSRIWENSCPKRWVCAGRKRLPRLPPCLGFSAGHLQMCLQFASSPLAWGGGHPHQRAWAVVMLVSRCVHEGVPLGPCLWAFCPQLRQLVSL